MAKLTNEFMLLTEAASFENVSTPFFTTAHNSIEVSKLPINKAARKFETFLADYLIDFANSVQKHPHTNLTLLASENDLNATLRMYAQQIYWLGAIYVSAFDEVKPILTKRDIDNITNLSEAIRQSIWKRIDKFFVREKLRQDEQTAQELSTLLKQGAIPKALKPIFKAQEHEPLNLDKQFAGLATVLTTSALNIGTIDKAQQISEGIANGQIINPRHIARTKFANAAFFDKFKGFADKVKRVEFRIRQGLNLTHEVIWITHEDDKVCNICLALAGDRFILEDPSTPKPIRDTHFNCRCRLLLLEGRKVFAA